MLTRAVSRAMSSSSSAGPLFLGLDASTQGLKATLVDASLRPVLLKGGGEHCAPAGAGRAAITARRVRCAAGVGCPRARGAYLHTAPP